MLKNVKIIISTLATKAACCLDIEIALHPTTALYLMCYCVMLYLLIIYIYIYSVDVAL